MILLSLCNLKSIFLWVQTNHNMFVTTINYATCLKLKNICRQRLIRLTLCLTKVIAVCSVSVNGYKQYGKNMQMFHRGFYMMLSYSPSYQNESINILKIQNKNGIRALVNSQV